MTDPTPAAAKPAAAICQSCSRQLTEQEQKEARNLAAMFATCRRCHALAEHQRTQHRETGRR